MFSNNPPPINSFSATKTQKDFNPKSLTKQADGIDKRPDCKLRVQSDLDLCRPQKYLYSPMALKGLKKEISF